MKFFISIILLLFCFSAKAQQTDYVDFKTVNTQLTFLPDSTQVSGKVKCTFKIVKNTDSIYIDAIRMKLNTLLLNTKKVDYRNDLKKIWVKSAFKKGKTYTLSFNYVAHPKKAMYFVERSNNWQIWTQGQGKYTSNWLPSVDDVNDKIEFDLSIIFKNDYEVIANGKLTDKAVGKEFTKWNYNMTQPMSSYLVALVIGKYKKRVETSKSGIPLEMYYYPEDSTRVEPTYRYTQKLFNFLEDEIGVPYPWQNYKQVPVKDFLYSGMENTSLTIFSDDFVIDDTSFTDKNYVNVNAHELAHQWFGDLVTAKKGEHHWLQEGFATYYALLAERDVFGDEYYYWKLFEYAQELVQQEEAGQHTALLNAKASSTTFYKKGAWVLHMLQQEIGEEKFKIAVKNYVTKYAFKTVETKDFITEAEKSSGKNLSAFENKWLLSSTLPYNEMITHLNLVSPTVNGYLKIDCEVYSSKCSEYLDSWIFDESKIKVIQQMPNKVKPEDFKNSIKVRQAIAGNVTEIPLPLKANYETLLNDKSYITIELALYNLWVNFPEERKKYLDKTKAIVGFNNKNIRTLWLVLALNTKDYNNAKKENFYSVLIAYTSPKYSYQLRQNAFSILDSINALNDVALLNLIQASKHHNWRFKSFARKLLKSLNEDEKYKKIIANLQAEQKAKQ